MKCGESNCIEKSNWLITLAVGFLPVFFLSFLTDAFILPKSLLLIFLGFISGFLLITQKNIQTEIIVSGLFPLVFLFYLFEINEYQIQNFLLRVACLSAFLLLWIQSGSSSRKDIQRNVYTILVSFSIIWVIGFFQYFNWSWEIFQSGTGKYKVFSLLGNPNHFGGFCAVLFFIVEIRKDFLILRWKNFFQVLCVIGLGFSGSLGAFISFFAGCLFYCSEKWKLSFLKKIGCVLIFVLCSGSLYYFQPGKIQMRRYIIDNTLKIIQKHPFSGVGFNGFSQEFSLVSGETNLEDRGKYSPSMRNRYYYAHFEILEWIAETGLKGVFWILILGYYWKKKKIGISFSPALIVLLMHSMISPVFHQPGIMVVLFLIPPDCKSETIKNRWIMKSITLLMTGFYLFCFIVILRNNYQGTLLWRKVLKKVSAGNERLIKEKLNSEFLGIKDPWIEEINLTRKIISKNSKDFEERFLKLIESQFSNNLLQMAGIYWNKRKVSEPLKIWMEKGAFSVKSSEALPVYKVLSRIWLENKEVEKLNQFTQELTHYVSSPDKVLKIRAETHFECKQYDEACIWLNRYLQKNSNEYKTWYNLGCYFIRAKKTSMAKICFQKSYKICREYSPAYLNMGFILFEQEKYAESKWCFEKILLYESPDTSLHQAALKNKKIVDTLLLEK